jgi:cytochrome b-561
MEERLGLSRFTEKFLRKAFPVHSTFFLGEIALFSFVLLVLTGVFLALMYEPSTLPVEYKGGHAPAAYVSVIKINEVPFGVIIRQMHHWAAHVMIAAAILHLLRVFFTGAYRNPREINWIVGLLLLGLTMVEAFVGYVLPFDQFAVTATKIGYGIARSVPWVGPYLADLFFAGRFPAPGSVPRFHAMHIMLFPLVMAIVLGLHLVILLKQKHTEPAGNRGRAPAGQLIGVPLWPHQTVLMLQLFLLLTAGLMLLAGFFPAHPIELYGPPRPGTPQVKPDWYFLWVYGLLKLIPSWMEAHVLGTVINPENIGGVLLPGLLGLVLLLWPFLDRARQPQHYVESPPPRRIAWGVGLLVLIGVLAVAGYADDLQLSKEWLRAVAIGGPVWVGLIAYLLKRAMA